MSYGLLGTLLLLLPGAASAEERWVQQSPRQLWVLPGETAELSCRISNGSGYVNWYKEELDGSLYWIKQSLSCCSPVGRYSAKQEDQQNFPLIISPTQREDSGVYYCSSIDFHPIFGDGTRLIVTAATEPELSILVPVDVEEPGQPPTDIPLLCHLHNVPPGWDTVRWQPSGEVTEVTAVATGEHGVLSAWSITRVSPEQRDGTVSCTAVENSTGTTLSVAIAKGLREGN
ncbi:M1-specific T cell receptor beta chain-like [Tyto alba]|uniref:M1-specific T cell receptor beta chain-like n=1 Tax=Tyto alba TaxID=56313 RepID=UPI00140422D0|nr:M1-specific T cell receptor beta chain-like [Tyto alba]